MLKLYHNAMSVCAQKVRIQLAAKNLDWQGEHLNIRNGDQFKPEFLKISPKAVVPVLIHDGQVINESNVILEYLEDVFPETPLRPADHYQRAMMRKWLIQLETHLHVDVATISFSVAFRYQVLAKQDSPEKLEQFFNAIPDARRAQLIRGMVTEGLDYAGVVPAISAYDKILKEMEQALQQTPWLVGDTISLADIGFAPYITRLAQLQLQGWWQDKPHVQAWYKRLCATDCYRQGLLDWNDENYLAIMTEKGQEAWPQVAEIIASL